MRSRIACTCALALMVWACGGTPGSAEPQATGQLTLPLTSPGPDGLIYQLVGATFTITGPQNVTISDTSTPTVSIALPAGLYSVQLGGNWHLERSSSPGNPVPAQLISPNPLSFSLGEGETRVVRFLFKTPANGDADLGFTVDTGGWITGTMNFTNMDPSGNTNIFAELEGKTVPFTISFASSTLSKEWGFEQVLHVQTSPITIQFGGAPSQLLQERIIPALENGPVLDFILTHKSSGQIQFSGFELFGSAAEPFHWMVFVSAPFNGVVDSEGFPKPQSFQFEAPNVLEYYGPSYSRADGMASGSVQPQ